jgi:hypothetical protein
VHRGTGPVHRAGDICQPGCVRLEDRRVHHRPRAGTRQAAVTQQPRDHTPTAPRSACGGRHTVAREVRGDRRTPHPTAASGVAPVAEARVRRERVRPRDRSHDTRRTAHPTRPVARDRAGFALARDRKGDMRKPQAHPRLPVSRGGRRRRPPGRHVWGSPPDRVTRLARQRGGGLPVQPGRIVVPLVCLASGRFPAPLQGSRPEAVCRRNSGIRPGRTRCLSVAPLETRRPLRLQWGARDPSGVFCRETERSRGGLEPVPQLCATNTIQDGPGETQAQRRPISTHTPAAAVAPAIRPAPVCRSHAPPAPPPHPQAA